MARVRERHVGCVNETKGEDGPGINNLGAGISDLIPEITTRIYDFERSLLLLVSADVHSDAWIRKMVQAYGSAD